MIKLGKYKKIGVGPVGLSTSGNETPENEAELALRRVESRYRCACRILFSMENTISLQGCPKGYGFSFDF